MTSGASTYLRVILIAMSEVWVQEVCGREERPSYVDLILEAPQ